jgi:soluble cytochrome b562
MTDRPRPSQESFDLSEDEISPEHLDTQVQKAQEQLLSLKRQQEQIERQKRELEELSRRQDQLQIGRSDLIEKLTRALAVLEREEYEAHKRVETLKDVRESYGQHLQYFESLDLKGLEGAELNRELTRALSALDDANTDFKRSYPKIDTSGSQLAAYEQQGELGGNAEFLHWFKLGVAFTLPLTVTGLLLFYALLTGGRN